MKLAESDLEAKASEVVSDCFAEVPFCSLRWGKKEVPVGTDRIDRIGKLTIDGEGERTLLLEVKRDGQPRFLREAAYALRRYGEEFKRPYGVVVAPYISDAAAEILAEEGVGYVDFAGNCRIAVGKVYIRKSGQANRFTEKRDLRSLYSPKAERVLRVLLENPKRKWLLKPLSEAADVSLGQVSNVKKLLDGREWLKDTDKGILVTNYDALLTEWSKSYQPSRNVPAEYYAMASLSEIERAVAGENEGPPLGALTGFSAAARFAPAVRYQRAQAYVKGRTEAVAERLGWKPVTSGGNVTLIQPYDEGVFEGSKVIDGVNVVSPVQAYLDLWKNPGRGEEAAEALYREVIKPSW